MTCLYCRLSLAFRRLHHTGMKVMLKDLASDVTYLPSRENLLWLAVGTGLALAARR